ncbi:MAG: hypothetical protein HY913_10250 [Desulfomonile tiedjei]|nr:hypothetical protein [Desulfomonile tiedjei]
MITKSKTTKRKPSEEEIDSMVVAQADNDSAWEEPIQVRRTKAASLSIPAKLAARAAFLAKLHREKSIEEWLTRIIRERIELEEIAFSEVKRELKGKQTQSGRRLKTPNNQA